MAILFRGTRENFNPQIMTEANSLTSNMNKHFEVKKKSLDLFARYTKFQSFMYASGRFNRGANAGKVIKMSNDSSEGIKDNAYRIMYDGSLILPAVSYGAAYVGAMFEPGNPTPDMSAVAGVVYQNGVTAGTVVTNTLGSIAIKHDPEAEIYGDKFNPNDSIVLDSGLGSLFIITQHPRRSTDGSHYVLDGKFVGPATLYKAEFLDADVVFGEGGTFFGEGSLRGWQRYQRNRWRINYTSIHRSSVTMTGSAKQQKVQWVTNPDTGNQMWEFEAVLRHDQLFHVHNELSLRHARISMDPSDHTWFENFGKNKLTLQGFIPESGIAAPILGDGWIPQIQDNFIVDYDPNAGLNMALVEVMLMVLGQRSPLGSDNNTFLVVGDVIGRRVLDAALKKMIGFGNPGANTAAGTMTGNIVNITTGKNNELGFEITTYHYLGNTIYFMQDELLNHPGLQPTNAGVTGSGHMYILNTSMVDGVPNFEMLARNARSFRRKYENGMHSFDESQDNSSVASSGFDGCSIHSLSEMMAIVYDIRSSGIFRATTKFNGGPLAGNAYLGAGASSFLF